MYVCDRSTLQVLTVLIGRGRPEEKAKPFNGSSWASVKVIPELLSFVLACQAKKNNTHAKETLEAMKSGKKSADPVEKFVRLFD